MVQRKTVLQISILCLGLFFALTTNASAEVIKTFDAQIIVNKDASVSVVETIVYDSEGLEKHGIYRDITPRNAKGEVMKIQDISVVDAIGAPYHWQQQRNNGDTRLKIGDPNATFVGEKTYVVSYTATNAVSFFDEYDEIYWNATGNNWSFGINAVTAQVSVPGSGYVRQESCYVGVKGSTERCFPGSGQFYSKRALLPGEGMTVAVGFPKGITQPYIPATKDKIRDFMGLWWPIVIPLFVLIYMWKKWYRIGRDAKGRGLIVSEYEVVDNLTPLEAAVIINQSFTGKDIIAEVLSLAVRGYISIEQTEEKKFIGKSIDYTLMLTKLPDETLAPFDKQLLKEIFNTMTVGTVTVLSQNHSFYAMMGSLTTSLKKHLVENEYYTKDFLPKSLWDKVSPTGKQLKYVTAFFILVVVFLQSPLSRYVWEILGFTADQFTSLFIQELTPIVFLGSIILAVISYSIFKHIMPAKTQKGALVRERLLGLKEYIQVAEKDRIAFHNAPETNPKLFEVLLPYAIMFGFEKKWVKAFEGITLQQPRWYSSPNGNFVPAVFISDFSNNFSSSFFSTPSSSSGSSGGGLSGGGGGGGGGGSW